MWDHTVLDHTVLPATRHPDGLIPRGKLQLVALR